MLRLLLEWVPVALAAGAGWFWFDSMRARETAVRRGRETCVSRGLLFLDDTVALDSLGFMRGARGRLMLRRTYRFEFSDTGNNRLRGSVVMAGARVEIVSLEPHAEYTEGNTLLR